VAALPAAGLNDAQVLDIFRAMQFGGCAMEGSKKTCVFMTVRSPRHAVKVVEQVIEDTGTKKLDVAKLTEEAENLFSTKMLWPLMTVKEHGHTFTLTGKYLDCLGGFLESEVFNATNTGDDEYEITFPNSKKSEILSDLKELCQEWGWHFQGPAPQE